MECKYTLFSSDDWKEYWNVIIYTDINVILCISGPNSSVESVNRILLDQNYSVDIKPLSAEHLSNRNLSSKRSNLKVPEIVSADIYSITKAGVTLKSVLFVRVSRELFEGQQSECTADELLVPAIPEFRLKYLIPLFTAFTRKLTEMAPGALRLSIALCNKTPSPEFRLAVMLLALDLYSRMAVHCGSDDIPLECGDEGLADSDIDEDDEEEVGGQGPPLKRIRSGVCGEQSIARRSVLRADGSKLCALSVSVIGALPHVTSAAADCFMGQFAALMGVSLSRFASTSSPGAVPLRFRYCGGEGEGGVESIGDDGLVKCLRRTHGAFARTCRMGLEGAGLLEVLGGSGTAHGCVDGALAPPVYLGADATLKPMPVPGEPDGFAVMEFFSGIGGMRLSLPGSIRLPGSEASAPVSSVTAYDISEVCNTVYRHNFHGEGGPRCGLGSGSGGGAAPLAGGVHSKLIDGLKIADVDGAAHVWTMSPPCQPYTSTKGALQLDKLDNRSKGLYHLMFLLRHMRLKPRWIVLENVAAFASSEALADWKRCLRECGYSWRQCMLSPDSCGLRIPNSRRRYYMIIEHGERFAAYSGSGAMGDAEPILSAFPAAVLRAHAQSKAVVGVVGEAPAFPSCYIGFYIHPQLRRLAIEGLAANTDTAADADVRAELDQLTVPMAVLATDWLQRNISVTNDRNESSYCITKSYGAKGRGYDKSAGSCYYMQTDPLAPPPTGKFSFEGACEVKSGGETATLSRYHGKLRLFHPTELLALSGFPSEFAFPGDLTHRKQYACIGNSINVAVVRGVMLMLFQELD